MSITLVVTKNEVLSELNAHKRQQVRCDLFVVNLNDSVPVDEIVGVMKHPERAVVASVCVIGDRSETAHDMIDEFLVNEVGPPVENWPITSWKDSELDIASIAHEIRWLSPTGHALVWVPDSMIRAMLERAVMKPEVDEYEDPEQG
jgi:hypothetical protein